MTLFIFILFSVAEVLRHWYLISRRNISPNKAFSLIARAIVGAVAILFDPLPLWATIPTYAVVDWVLHDYLLSILRGVRPIWLLNNTGPIDKFQRNYPNAFVWFTWKVLAFVGLLLCYYFN